MCIFSQSFVDLAVFLGVIVMLEDLFTVHGWVWLSKEDPCSNFLLPTLTSSSCVVVDSFLISLTIILTPRRKIIYTASDQVKQMFTNVMLIVLLLSPALYTSTILSLTSFNSSLRLVYSSGCTSCSPCSFTKKLHNFPLLSPSDTCCVHSPQSELCLADPSAHSVFVGSCRISYY